VIGLGLRLVVSGGREAITRLVVLAAAVGLGVGLLLTAVAATNAAVTWNNRHAWFWTGAAYYLLTAGGILAALGIIAATFPLLARITGPEVARNE
jgi:hypothetical protein